MDSLYDQKIIIHYARILYQSISRRSPEGKALVSWLEGSRSFFGGEELKKSKNKVSEKLWTQIGDMLNIHWENVKTATVDNFSENHALFSDHFHLDDVERALFDIACRYHSCSVFEGLVDAGIESEHAKAPSLLSLLLGVSKQDIKKRLSKGAPLITSGLLSIDEWDLRKGSFYLEPVENLITALSYPNHGNGRYSKLTCWADRPI